MAKLLLLVGSLALIISPAVFAKAEEDKAPARVAASEAGTQGPFQDDAIEWDKGAGKTVSFPDKGDPTVTLSGSIKEGHSFIFNDNEVEVVNGHFAIPVKLIESTNECTARIKIPQVGENIYKFTLTWKKLPPEKQFKVKIKEGGKIIEKSTSAVTKNQDASEWIESTPAVSRRAGRAVVKQFEIAALGIIDSLGGRVFTGQLAWAPEYHINRNWTLGAGLGIMLYKNQQSSFFPAIEYRVSIGRKFGKVFEAELNGGAQSWFNVQGFIPMLGVNFLVPRSWLFGDWHFLKYTKKFYLGYTYVGHASHAHLIRLGARFAF